MQIALSGQCVAAQASLSYTIQIYVKAIPWDLLVSKGN